MRRFAALVVLALSCLGCALAKAQCQGWLQRQSGTAFDDAVYAMTTWDPDGSGPLSPWLVVAGDFTTTGLVAANRIAAWDGTAWHALGSGINGPVYALGSYNGELIAAGVFNSAGGTAVSNIARYRVGQGWRSVGSGTFFGPIYSVAEYQGELVVGGDFLYRVDPQGPGFYSLCRWNGAAVRSVPYNGPAVNALQVNNGDLFVGTFGGGLYAMNFFGNYTTIGSGSWYSLCVHNGQLIASWSLNANPVYRVLGSWPNYQPSLVADPNGTQPLLDGTAYAMSSNGDRLFIGGSFTRLGTTPAPHCASWNSTTGWSPMGVGTNGPVLAMCAYGSEVFVGGAFTEAGGTNWGGPYLARWTDLSAPSINQQPQATNANEGSVAMFQVAATSPQGGPTYQWRHNGDLIVNGPGGISISGGVVSGASGPVLTISGVLQSDAGTFTCVVSNGCATTTSAPAVLVVTPVCNPDFNRDGNVDQDDVSALINAVAGGGCP